MVGDAEDHERPDHEDVPVSEVDQLENAVHHAVAERDQRIDAPQGEAVDQLLNDAIGRDPGRELREAVHALLPLVRPGAMGGFVRASSIKRGQAPVPALVGLSIAVPDQLALTVMALTAFQLPLSTL